MPTPNNIEAVEGYIFFYCIPWRYSSRIAHTLHTQTPFDHIVLFVF